jgi:methylglutaconyl-CoA hydratase
MPGMTVAPVTDGVLVVELDRGPENLWTLADLRELEGVLTHPPEGAHVLRLRSVGEAFCLGRERGAPGAPPGVVRGEAETLVAITRAMRRTPLVTVAEVQAATSPSPPPTPASSSPRWASAWRRRSCWPGSPAWSANARRSG